VPRKREGADLGGRPPIHGETMGTRLPRLRCTDAQIERWQRAARAEGLSLSAWIRFELDAAASPTGRALE